MDCSMLASLPFAISWSLLKFTCTESVMLSNHLIFCHPLLLPSVFPSIRIFSNQLALCKRWPKDWSFSNSSSNDSGLISFRVNWFDQLAVQGTLKSFFPTPHFKNIDSSALRLHYGPILTSIHDYWKNHSSDYMDFVSKVMSLLFNMLSRFVVAFLPRRKRLLILWLPSLSVEMLEPKKIKSVTASTFSPSICHEVMGPDAMILVF